MLFASIMAKKLNKPKPKPVSGDAQKLLNNAVAFWEAAKRCDREAAPETVPPGENFGLGAPTVTCYAFSIELFLKLLAQLKKGSYTGNEHNLRELYFQLPAAVQAQIRANYARVGSVTVSRFVIELRKAADAFKEWRYVHEYDPLTHEVRQRCAAPDSLDRMAAALRETVREVAPGLRSFADA